jgi:hypothetical protein
MLAYKPVKEGKDQLQKMKIEQCVVLCVEQFVLFASTFLSSGWTDLDEARRTAGAADLWIASGAVA